ncbi:molybdenum cofactor sulfurylase [Sphaerotilus hippei]|uniref:Molybdenum cofactor sulfurylase n=1 Tax=Sphaerotilus hippei TaxID=744406 RepID=A0A318H1L6_9BURK|nr:xanthine dehydrogenase accessory protein XdhC [Sphaerotilus hippei]PXW97073.1 molybdenum cofactor sulfurylase [Sphaerotilus hippei]
MSVPPPLADIARHWLARGEPALDVEIVAHRGSVPRETGTHLLVSATEVAGTIGGGHLELRAIADARARLQAGATAATTDQHIALGPSLGQCCGGALTLRFQPLSAAGLARWAAPVPRFVLQLHGAGHVGRAIVRQLAALPCRVQWIDEREAEFPAGPLPPHIEASCVEPAEAEVACAPPGAFYLVLTHSHELDLRLTETILRRGDFGFCGLIGSQTKRARFLRRLEARGVPAASIARLTCPIGLPGIPGKEPEVLALAAVAQLFTAAHGP